jgi:hypothetical protein
MNIAARVFAILFVRIDGLALQLRVVINPLHCFLQSKIVGGIFRRESLIELSFDGIENRLSYFWCADASKYIEEPTFHLSLAETIRRE